MRITILLSLILVVFGQIACNANKKPTSLNLHMVVKGLIIDILDGPVVGAKVQAWLGLDVDGAAVETDSDGHFIAEVGAETAPGVHFKGCPGMKVEATKFDEAYVNFDCWDRGEREFERTIILKPKTEKSEIKAPL